VLGRTVDEAPVLARHAVGRGLVYYFVDPIELATDEQANTARRAIYSAVLRTTTIRPLDITPNEPWVHVMAQPTARATVHVVYNCKKTKGREDVHLPTAAGVVTLTTRNRYPALAAVTMMSLM
jgi:hypothetical protein